MKAETLAAILSVSGVAFGGPLKKRSGFQCNYTHLHSIFKAYDSFNAVFSNQQGSAQTSLAQSLEKEKFQE
jgi:hypothetical protein